MSHDSEDGKKVMAIFDKQVAQASTRSSVSSELTIQMQQYLRVNNLERKQDPLEWWIRNCHLHPHISKLAKNIFLLGTSVPSEQIFSKAGQLITKGETG